MRVLLRDLAPGQKYAIQFRSNDGMGNVSDWSQVTTFTTTNDTTPPSAVTNLTWAASGTSFVAQWSKVTTNADANHTPLNDLRDYHCNVSNGTTSADFYVPANHFEFSSQQNIATFGSLQTQLTLTVTARDRTYNESAPAVLTATPLNPPTPSTPVVGNYIGLLRAVWDGKDNAGNAMPSNFSYCEVHVSSDTVAAGGFTPSTATYSGMIQPGGNTLSYLISGLTYGTTYWVKLVAVNVLGKKSGGSTAASGVPARITGLDIQNGQIAAEQINWTATGIPGGNAYYQNTAPTLAQAIGGAFSSNDVWYDTGHSYTPNTWNGTTWVVNNSIGFIPATKIIAGTITGDRIAANFFDAALANIGTAFIDSAMITSITAGQITAGTMSAAVTISGRFATALTGARREMNQTGFQAWDSGGNQTINLDGVNNLLTGQFKTARTGRRIELGTSGDYGTLKFISPSGKTLTIAGGTASSTSPDPGAEYLNMGYAISGAHDSWNSLQSSSDEQITLTSGGVSLIAGGGNVATPGHPNGLFGVYWAYDKGDSTTDPRAEERIYIDKTSTDLYYPTPGGNFGVYEVTGSGTTSSSSSYRLYIDDNGNWFNSNVSVGNWFIWNGTKMSVGIISGQTNGDEGARAQFINRFSYGATVFASATSTGTNHRFEFKDAANSVYIPVWASSFTVQSSGTVKTDIQPLAAGALNSVKGMKVKTFRRQSGSPGKSHEKDSKGKNVGSPTVVSDSVTYNDRTEIGLIAEEAPPEIVVSDGSTPMIDLGSQLNLLVAAVQELAAEVDTLKNGKVK